MRKIYLTDSNKDVLQQMQAIGFNVTTCGSCGDIKLLSPKSDRENIECDYCDFVEEECYFPDLEIV